MRISAKARYGLAALIAMAECNNNNQCITVVSLSEKLNLSKIYLEQVFGLLKRSEIVSSIKGPQGGYYFAKPLGEISVYDILRSVDSNLFEKTENTVLASDAIIERVLSEDIFEILDDSVKNVLVNISLEDIKNQIEKHRDNDNYMFYL